MLTHLQACLLINGGHFLWKCFWSERTFFFAFLKPSTLKVVKPFLDVFGERLLNGSRYRILESSCLLFIGYLPALSSASIPFGNPFKG